MTRTDFLRKTMKAAWTIFRKGGKSFSQALKKAWKWAKKNLVETTITLPASRETAKAVLVDVNVYSHHIGDFIVKSFWLPKKGATTAVEFPADHINGIATITDWGLSLLRNKFAEEFPAGRGYELILR